ncbi:hypothetical protein J6590_000140 [Homalodisca vitripennis]|nr:hypothetical protein J6590_000140 [Homalodisca vitripennis]
MGKATATPGDNRAACYNCIIGRSHVALYSQIYCTEPDNATSSSDLDLFWGIYIPPDIVTLTGIITSIDETTDKSGPCLRSISSSERGPDVFILEDTDSLPDNQCNRGLNADQSRDLLNLS